jgi:hypothetical protein
VLLKFNKNCNGIRTLKIRQSTRITRRTPRSRFTKNLIKNSNFKTGHSSFLRTEAMESSNRVFDEFDTNLELLMIAYKV